MTVDKQKPKIDLMYIPQSIGTPLSPNAIRILLLGSGELGKELHYDSMAEFTMA